AVAGRAHVRDRDVLREAAVVARAQLAGRHVAVGVVVGEEGLGRRDRRADVGRSGGVLRLAAEREGRGEGDREQDADDDDDNEKLYEGETLVRAESLLEAIHG